MNEQQIREHFDHKDKAIKYLRRAYEAALYNNLREAESAAANGIAELLEAQRLVDHRLRKSEAV